ncbi:hypothetical protein [uncultured Kordia sp.]|uniref:tetratricopeptide repeat protein n=1 Tax=uncultured Kordia sp. TaxID=507699 RepID=UPI00262DA0E7|nr:hypothetical protein [uncultured Kordia sp.]
MNTVKKIKENFLSLNIFSKLILSMSCCLMFVENATAQKRDRLVVNYLKKSKKFAFENKRDSTLFYLEKAEQQALGDPEELFRVYSRSGIYFFREEIKLDAARVYLKKMQALLPDIDDEVLKAKIYNKTGYFYSLDGDLGKAYQSFYEALKINLKEDSFLDANVLAVTYIRMGRLYAKQSMNEDALDFGKKAMKLIDDGENVDKVFVYRQVGWIYKRVGNYEKALKYFDTAAYHNEDKMNSEKEGKKIKAHRNNIVITRNFAEVYYETDEKVKALNLALQSLQDAKNAKIKNVDMSLYLLLSKLYNDRGDFDLALKNALEAYEIALLRDIPGKLLITTKQLQVVYENKGNKDLAYHYLQKYITAKRRVDKEEGKWEITKEKMRIAQLESDQKVQEIQADSEKARLSTLLITGALVMSIGFGFVFYKKRKAVFLQEIAKKEKAKSKIQQRLSEEKQKAIAKEEELKAYMNMLSEDSNIDVKDIGEVKKIQNELRRFKILTESDWTGFKSIFQNIYPDFFKNFKVKSMNYSQGDLKLAALIRLNFNTKEIAEILVISPGSVRKGKYRLRKKMDFESEEELQKFIYDL